MPKADALRSDLSVRHRSGKLFAGGAFWGTALGHFCSNYPFYLMIVWLPFFLVSERHLSMTEMAWEGALFYLIYAIASPILAWIADSWIRAGASPNFVRKVWMGIGQVMIAAGILGCAAASARTSFVCLMVMGAACGFTGPNDLCLCPNPGRARGGRQMDGPTELICQPGRHSRRTLDRLVVDRTGQFWWAFVVAASITLLGGLSWVLLVGSARAGPVAGGELRRVRIVNAGALARLASIYELWFVVSLCILRNA